MRKKVLALGLCAAMAASSLAGCSSSDSGSGNAGNEAAGGAAPAGTEAPAAGGADSQGAGNAAANEDLEGSLVFTIWDNNLMDYIDSNDMVGKFQEKYPNAEIEVEKIKDDTEYWNAMKMRDRKSVV